MNQVSLIGRLGKDPELRYFESGKCLAEITIAVNRYNGKGKDKSTDWFSCKAWGNQAELIGEKFKKGDAIGIQGNIQQETWEKDGNKHSKHVVNVEKIVFLPGSGGSGKNEEPEEMPF